MLLARHAVMDYESAVKLVPAAAAEVSCVLFKDTESDVINSKDNTDAKHRFAKYDK